MALPDRIRKLLALARGSTGPESRAAHRKAQALAAKSGFILSDLDRSPIPSDAAPSTESGGWLHAWKEELADAIGRSMPGVKTMVDARGRLVVAGDRASIDRFHARYEAVSIALSAWASGTPFPAPEREMFLLGAAARVRKRLGEAPPSRGVVSTVTTRKALERWLWEHRDGLNPLVAPPIHADDLTSSPAFAAGWNAAAKLSIR